MVPVAQWVGQQVSEALGWSRILVFIYISKFDIMNLSFLGVFCFTLIKIMIPFDYQSVLYEKKLDSVGKLFFVDNIVFNITTDFILFLQLTSSVSCLEPCKGSLCQTQTSTRKHQNKYLLLRNVSVL